MKQILPIVLFLVYINAQAQDKSDNYSFFKLYVTNDKDEVLLVEWNGEWEIVGDRYNDPVSIKGFLEGMAKDMGITIKEPRLCGIYTQRWRGVPYLTMMQYYHAKFAEGELQIPPDCTDIRWFSYEEALKVIPYENMTTMMKEITKNPGKLIRAAFERYKDENNNTQFITLEEFHIMN